MKTIHKTCLMLFGISTMLGYSIVLYLTFLYAYFNGYKAMLNVNAFYEAHIEFICIPLTIIICIWSFKEFIKTLQIGSKMHET